MPHRNIDVQQVCRDCVEFAVSQCYRCGAPQCQSHKPAYDKHCIVCEKGFADLLASEQSPVKKKSKKIMRNASLMAGAYYIGVTTFFTAWYQFDWDMTMYRLGLVLALIFGTSWFARAHYLIGNIEKEVRKEFLKDQKPELLA